MAVRRTLMERARLVPSDTPTNAAYVQLPALYRVGGTIGVPDPKFDAVAFGVFAARVASGFSGLEGTDAGKALQGFSDLLGGRRPRDTNTSNIVPPSAGKTNEPTRGLGGLLDVLGGSRATNAPGTNQPATNAPVNPLDLFRRPRK
jgi:hypothetical protein